MDLRRLRIGDWVAAGWGAVLLGSLFLTWYSVPGIDFDAWRSFGFFDVILAALGVLALALGLLTARATSPTGPIALDVLTSALAAVCLLVVVWRHINEPGPNAVISIDAGAYIGLLATAGIFAGACSAMRDERMPAVPQPPLPEAQPAPPAA